MQREKIAKQRSRKLVYQFDKEGEQLENYTKYKLKSNDELAELLADKDHLFVVVTSVSRNLKPLKNRNVVSLRNLLLNREKQLRAV